MLHCLQASYFAWVHIFLFPRFHVSSNSLRGSREPQREDPGKSKKAAWVPSFQGPLRASGASKPHHLFDRDSLFM